MPRLTVKIVLGLIVVGLVVLALIFGPAACNSYFNQKKRAEIAKGQAGAAVDSGAEAMNTVSDVQAKDKAADATLKEATDEVRKAPPGNSNDAALRAACKLRKHINSERCARLRAADTGKPAPAR